MRISDWNINLPDAIVYFLIALIGLIILGIIAIICACIYRRNKRKKLASTKTVSTESSSALVAVVVPDKPKAKRESKIIEMIKGGKGKTLKRSASLYFTPTTTTKRNDSLMGDNSRGKLGEIQYAKKSFKNVRADEIQIKTGDPVSVFRLFEDGWVHGMNWRLNLSGMFPLAVLEESARD